MGFVVRGVRDNGVMTLFSRRNGTISAVLAAFFWAIGFSTLGVAAPNDAEKKAAPKAPQSKTAPTPKDSKKDSPKKDAAKKDAGKKDAPSDAAASLPRKTLPAVRTAAPSPAEVAHKARFDATIAPVLAHPLSATDAELIRNAVKAISAGDLARAGTLQGQMTDPVGRKLIDWWRLRGGYGTATEIQMFLDENPAWPDRPLLMRRLEEALFMGVDNAATAAAIVARFANTEPESGSGMAALAAAVLASGDETRARALASRAWREENFSAKFEGVFLRRLGSLLTPEDHKWRFDRLVMDDIRWSGERNERAALVRRVIPLLSPTEQKKARARLAVFLKSASAKGLMDGVAKEAVGDWGFVFHRIQLLRRAKKDDEATKLMLEAPTDQAQIVSPDGWWGERRALAYRALEAKNPKRAYALVRDAGPLTVNPLKEQTFMAGWIAFRYLKDLDAAETHFQAYRKAADGPLSRAKSAYWLGRLAEARGAKDDARAQYQLAAREVDTFHGLMARQKLAPGAQAIAIEPPAAPTPEEVKIFTTLDAVRAVMIAKKAGLEANTLRIFFFHLRVAMKSEAGGALVAHLADAMGDTQTSLRLGKAGVGQGHNLLYYSYPVHPFPEYTPLRLPPEMAFLLGVARQESEFNTLTVSGAGAKGLLQVMTVTARHVCTDYKIKCQIDRLLTDKPYNTMLASAYIADRMEEFDGSYVLGLAGYNAGPGRAREWIRAFGDPRDPKIDPIDWIERIPFQETREYVAKVLANIQIYRARLNEAEPALRLDDDLLSGRPVAVRAKKAPDSGAGE